MNGLCRNFALPAMLVLVPAAACAAAFQFEAIGASDSWIVIRENIPASPADTAACSYPGLDPSEYVGVMVRFMRLSPEAKRGRLVPLDMQGRSMTLYTPARRREDCTSSAEADRRWREIDLHAKSLGAGLSAAPPTPVVLGEAVPAKACVLIGGAATAKSPCRRVFTHPLKGGPIRIAVSLAAVPEAPDLRSCQFVGHRFGAAIQVAGLNFATMDSGIAPGGFAGHYDCRAQQFNPLRLYLLDQFMVLLGGFRGTNIADRDEHPFLVVFPVRPAL
jgi:hypothetical protein